MNNGKAPAKPANNLRVLYVGLLGSTDSSAHRCRAIERLGHGVVEFDTQAYQLGGNPFLRSLRNRSLIGWNVYKLNRDILDAAAEHRPSLIWFDKASYVTPGTVRKLRGRGAYTVHFNIDNPFGPRQDPGMRLILKAVPEYDLHLVQRDVNLEDYRRAGARDVQLMRTAYEKSIHFPPPDAWSDADRLHDVVFIGTPYDNRAGFLTELAERYAVSVSIWGDLWDKKLSPNAKSTLWRGEAIYNKAYRETMWRSRICLSFVTHSNHDDVAHKSFEIAASGAFLLAEDTAGHRAHFSDGREAVFFRSAEECARQIRRYLPDEAMRSRIAVAGRRRAVESGYSNDDRVARVFEYIESHPRFVRLTRAK